MVIIFVVALVLFGPKKLPELGRTIGKAITEFRRASSELKSTFEREMQSLEREHESLKEVTHSYAREIQSHYDPEAQHTSGSGYDSPYDYGAYGSESYDPHTASNSSTVGESAGLDAEQHGTGQTPSNGNHPVPGTVARGSAEAASHSEKNGAGDAGQPDHEEAHGSLHS